MKGTVHHAWLPTKIRVWWKDLSGNDVSQKLYPRTRGGIELAKKRIAMQIAEGYVEVIDPRLRQLPTSGRS